MKNSHLALAKSGTVVLELALHKIPTVVPYAINPLDVFLATKVFQINLPFYSMPNIIMQKEVFPELFGPQLTEKSLNTHAENLWHNETRRKECVADCDQLWTILGDKSASKIAAEKILQQLVKLM